MTDDLVHYQRTGKVGVVTMNRPQKRNALDDRMIAGLLTCFEAADKDGETSVVVLRAEGPSFSAGYDLAGDSERRSVLTWHDLLSSYYLDFEMTPWNMRKPTIASVQGHALGGGCELAMFCDLTVAADDARFGEPEIRFSTVGPVLIMPYIIGFKRARELIYFGDSIDAATALSFGMINRVVPAARLAEETMRYAERLALVAPEALVKAKQAINRGGDAIGLRNAMVAGTDVLAPLYATETGIGKEFHEIARRDGLGAAARWRAAQFKD